MAVSDSNIDLRICFTGIYEKYFGVLCAYVYRFFPDRDEAEEIVQDVMLKLWEKKELMQEVDSIKSYLYRSVHNACLNRLEHLKVKGKYADYHKLKLLEIDLAESSDYEGEHEMEEIVLKEVEELSPKVRAVFELRYKENLRYKEIAERLNISERTVESHLQHTIRNLREKFRKFI